jgi:hypothetical protein
MWNCHQSRPRPSEGRFRAKGAFFVGVLGTLSSSVRWFCQGPGGGHRPGVRLSNPFWLITCLWMLLSAGCDRHLKVEPLSASKHLGPFVTDQEPISNTFAFVNKTGRVLRLMKAIALSPCCSAIVTRPDAIPPGARFDVSVAH